MTALAPLLAAALAAAPAPLEVHGFGTVAIHAPAGAPARTVVLLSGAGGLDASVSALADALAAKGALVVAVDTPAYLAARPEGRCVYPAGDLEELAQHVEKLQAVRAYERPVVVGHSRGAAVAWAAASNAPAGTFLGAVAVAPCPERPLPVKLCGHGTTPRAIGDGTLPPLAPPSAPVEIVAAGEDATCPAGAAEGLAKALGARFTKVAGAGHALAGPLDEAVVDAVERLAPATATSTPTPIAPSTPTSPATSTRSPPPSIADLPVVEVPSKKPGRAVAVLLTGDGGWVGADKGLANALADGGVSVVGLDSLRYFWQRRTPEETARDVARIFAHYRAAWGRDESVLVGYSRGADIVPILAGLLPADERAHLALVAMLGPSTFAEFEVHAIDIFTNKRRSNAIDTEPALRRTAGAVPMICFHGAEEHDSLCPRLRDLPWVQDVMHQGGHRLGSDEASEMARAILGALAAPRGK